MIATTRAAILRGTATDEFGELIDDNTTPAVGLTDFPASIIETAKDVFDPAESTLRTVRKLTGRIPASVVLLEGDRLRDNRTGEVFIIDAPTSQRRGISGRASVTLTLRRTGG